MTSIPRAIILVTRDKLDSPKSWFAACRKHVPVCDHNGSALVISAKEDGVHHQVPVARDLSATELDRVAKTFGADHPEVRHEIRFKSVSRPDCNVDLDDARYLNLCRAWAKRQHMAWMNDRLASGWRYGSKVSLRDKTHPLLRPWDDLPDQFRDFDPEQPRQLIDLLNDQGYAVIAKSELESMLRLMRSIL